jgi:hypothetical protein
LAVFGVIGWPGSAQAQTMRKGPYLLYPGTNTEMTVLWQLTGTTGCTLEWGTDTSYSDGSVATSEYGGDHQHQYTITGLVPGTKYYYRVTGAGTHTGSFRAAPSGAAGSVKIIAYGDTRTNPGDYSSVAEDIISTYTSDPDYQTLALLSGDWVNAGDSESDWDNQFFNRGYSNLTTMQANLPINGCMGNHEQSGTVYMKYWPYPYLSNRYWSFDYGPVHVVVVDQYVSVSTGSPQLTWIESDLAATTKPWKIMVLHAPGWSAGGHIGESEMNDVQNYLQPLCVTYGVDLVIGGHNHYYARCVVAGVQHITTGGGGAPLYSVGSGYPYQVTGSNGLHFCTIDIQPGQLTYTAINTSGVVLDSFTLTDATPTPTLSPTSTPTPRPGVLIEEPFHSMPTWTTQFFGGWGSDVTLSIESGGQDGTYMQGSRASQGSAARVRVYTVPAGTDLDLSIYMRCPTFGGTYWHECAYKLGSHTAQDFDENSGTWTMIKKFSNAGFDNGNGDAWTQYTDSVNSGAETQISIGYKLGSSGGAGPTVGWDSFLVPDSSYQTPTATPPDPTDTPGGPANTPTSGAAKVDNPSWEVYR